MEEQVRVINDKILNIYIDARTKINVTILACRKKIKTGALNDFQMAKYEVQLESLIKQRELIQNRINAVRKKIKLGIASYSKGESGKLKSVIENDKDQSKIDKNNKEFLSLEQKCLIASETLDKFNNFNTLDEKTNFALNACMNVRNAKIERLQKKKGNIAQKQASFVGNTVSNTISKVKKENKIMLIRKVIEKAVNISLAKGIIQKRELQITEDNYADYLDEALNDEEHPLLKTEKAILKTNDVLLKTRIMLLQTKNGILRGLQRFVYVSEEKNNSVVGNVKKIPKAVAGGWNDLLDSLKIKEENLVRNDVKTL